MLALLNLPDSILTVIHNVYMCMIHLGSYTGAPGHTGGTDLPAVRAQLHQQEY